MAQKKKRQPKNYKKMFNAKLDLLALQFKVSQDGIKWRSEAIRELSEELRITKEKFSELEKRSVFMFDALYSISRGIGFQLHEETKPEAAKCLKQAALETIRKLAFNEATYRGK